MYSKNPLKSDGLCEMYRISKGTLLNEIHEVNEVIFGDAKIVGIKNKGYYLQINDDISPILFANKFMKNNASSIVKNVLYAKENGFLSEDEIEIIDLCVDYISNNMLLYITNRMRLTNVLALILKMMQFSEDERREKVATSIKKLVSFIEFKTGYTMNQQIVDCLEQVLSLYTDRQDIDFNEYDKLEEGVNALINDMIKIYPDLQDEKNALQMDIALHLKSQLASGEFNNGTNKLLNDIKTQYINVFNDVKKCISAFRKFYNLKFSDDQIGYITLYFCRSLDKVHEIKEARVMVVCNTGRGASKFLATRIMNNCPEIHIVAMSSYPDIHKDKSILDNIDLIISTIALPDIPIPYVIVSPLLTNAELIKIREACRIGRGGHGKIVNSNISETVDSIVSRYVNYNDAKELTDKLTNLINVVETKPIDHIGMDIAEKFSMISLEISNELVEMFPKRIVKNQLEVMAGLTTHIFMSIPRWEKGDFVSISEYRELEEEYPEEYKKASELLNKISSILNLYIDHAEAFTILKYLTLLQEK